MRPSNLKTKIFLDSGDPSETREALALLGFLDGQTTNPSLIAKNPEAQERLARGEKFTSVEVNEFYKKVAIEISGLLPEGSVSLEVYADAQTTAQDALAQGKEMFSWIPNAHIKYPITPSCLEATEQSVAAGLRVNLTLCFSESQAAAVYAATKAAAHMPKGSVFVSPFVGRLDDIGQNGMDLIKNCYTLYQEGDGHVEILSASIRSMEHFLASIAYGADIITAPLKILKAWAEAGMPVPEPGYIYPHGNLTAIPKESINLQKDWREYNLRHDLTDKGLVKFATDWKALFI
ncbi:MAG TPA: transaldolase family protein [Patescibacteria group bacterium]|nr:transaldolase family protein [Patescibacteria group bacterium]